MRTLGIIAICVVGLIVGLVAWYKITYPSYTHRYRLSITVDIDGKAYTGSSVIEVRWIGQPTLGEASPFVSNVRGQAAFVDLGQHGALVATLHRGNIQEGATNADILAIRAFQVSGGFESYRIITEQVGSRELKPDNMPRLIWFPNVADPNSARQVTPEDIPALFGPGAQLSGSVEITRDPILIDIDKKLAWYNKLANSQKHGVTGSPGIFQLVYNMFVGGGT
jgi:hypothetical protein